MGLLDRIKTTITGALAAPANESRELSYLRQIYQQQGGVQRNSFYRILNQSGDNVGFSFVCNCGTEYQLLHVADWLRQNTCPTCKTQFDLLKACGITTETPTAQWPQFFAKLPARPRLSGSKPRSPYIDTWGNDNADTVQWGGSKPSLPEGWV
jgi:hypothetical protein